MDEEKLVQLTKEHLEPGSKRKFLFTCPHNNCRSYYHADPDRDYFSGVKISHNNCPKCNGKLRLEIFLGE